MYISTPTTPVKLEELAEHVLISRRVTLRDRTQLMQALLQDALTETEVALIDRLLYGIRKGLLQIDLRGELAHPRRQQNLQS